MSCLDENLVVDLLLGRASGRPLADAETHLATCDDCAQLLADAVATVSLYPMPAIPKGPGRIQPTTTSIPQAPGDDVGAPRVGALAPGTALNETYRVIRFIGCGGMGEVYEVAHARLSGRYAAKVLTAQVVATKEILSRFRREAQITSALCHPNIVRVIDFNWTSEGRPFLAMEYLEGVHLGRIIQTEGPLAVARVLQIVAPIVSALGAVHRREIIHRDLKPQNIVLVASADAGGEVVKLLDFGLSKRTGLSASESLLVSQQRVLLGTPLYMAPEQARGDNENISSAADQFSLGAIVYEMLTRNAAFAGDSVPAVLYRIGHVEPEPMRNFVAGIPEPVEQVVRRALSKDPLSRFPSIGAFFDALQAAALAPRAHRSVRAAAVATSAVLAAAVALFLLIRPSAAPPISASASVLPAAASRPPPPSTPPLAPAAPAPPVPSPYPGSLDPEREPSDISRAPAVARRPKPAARPSRPSAPERPANPPAADKPEPAEASPIPTPTPTVVAPPAPAPLPIDRFRKL